MIVSQTRTVFRNPHNGSGTRIQHRKNRPQKSLLHPGNDMFPLKESVPVSFSDRIPDNAVFFRFEASVSSSSITASDPLSIFFIDMISPFSLSYVPNTRKGRESARLSLHSFGFSAPFHLVFGDNFLFYVLTRLSNSLQIVEQAVLLIKMWMINIAVVHQNPVCSP